MKTHTILFVLWRSSAALTWRFVL